MKLSYWWDEMKSEALTFAKECEVCNRHKRAGKTTGEMQEKAEIPLRPWDSVALDFCGPFPRKHSEAQTEGHENER